MPVIRVSSNDPNSKHLRRAFKIIKEQNMNFRSSFQEPYSPQKIPPIKNVRYQQPLNLSVNVDQDESEQISLNKIDPSEYIEAVNENGGNLPPQQMIDQNKQIQILLQKQLNKYKTLKDVNELFFYTPKNHAEGSIGKRNNKVRDHLMSQRSSMYSNGLAMRSESAYCPTLIKRHGQDPPDSVRNRGTSIPRHLIQSQHSSPNRLKISENFKQQIKQLSINQSMPEDKLQQIMSTRRDEDLANSPQRVYCLNDQCKLNYDKDSFLRFYKLKKSLQSQNILFNQLQKQQMLNKITKEQCAQYVENHQDFFVNARHFSNSELILHIHLGSSVVHINGTTYIFGGKSQEPQRGLTIVKYDSTTQGLQFEQLPQSSSPVFDRYGAVAHVFQDKIVIMGGEAAKLLGHTNARCLLGDMLFYDPVNLKSHPITFCKPLKKVRAIASYVLGKYLYYYGGMLDNGEVVNEFIRIKLCQNIKWNFKWRQIQCFETKKNANNLLIQKQELATMPHLAFSKMCVVYYDQKLQEYEKNLEKFHVAVLSKEIDWQFAQNYIGVEGLYLFGGFNLHSEAVNDLYVIQVDPHKTHYLVKPKTLGKTPCPRFMHSMDYFSSSNVLIVCGGRNDQLKPQSILNDIHVLYLDSLTWTEVTFCSQKIKPCFNFISLIVDTRLLIFGGQTDGFKISHDYEVIELDQEVNFATHASKYLFKKMAAFIRANLFSKSKENNQSISTAPQEPTVVINESQKHIIDNEMKKNDPSKKKSKKEILDQLLSRAKKNSQILDTKKLLKEETNTSKAEILPPNSIFGQRKRSQESGIQSPNFIIKQTKVVYDGKFISKKTKRYN